MSVTSTDVPVDCDAGHGNDAVNARDVCDVCHDLYTVMTRDICHLYDVLDDWDFSEDWDFHGVHDGLDDCNLRDARNGLDNGKSVTSMKSTMTLATATSVVSMKALMAVASRENPKATMYRISVQCCVFPPGKNLDPAKVPEPNRNQTTFILYNWLF